MNPIDAILASYPIIILDGALATELERRGCNLKDPLWSAKVLLEEPELIRQLHTDYFIAGADCAITASYQATVAGLRRRGLNEDAALDVIRRSVEIAKEARDAFWREAKNRDKRPRPFVAASVGPYGAYLADGSEYHGHYGVGTSELETFHRLRMETLLAAGPELLACETIPCLSEAEALVHLLGEFPRATAWISFTARDGEHLRSGERFADAVALVDGCDQVAAVGVNCTSPEFVPALIHRARSQTSRPILAYPNSGERYDLRSASWSGAPSCSSFGTAAREWYRRGARLIGGCCRTTPDDIRAIAAWARGDLSSG